MYDGNPGQRAKIAPLVPAMAGYAIESLATKLLLPKEWSGYRVVLQDPHGSTRPDVVLYEGDRDIAWYDITADSTTSQGHIFTKVGAGWRTKPFVAEVFYNPVSASVVESSMAYVSAGRPR